MIYNKPPEEFEIENLLDLKTLQQFQDIISSITGVASLIVKPNGDPLTQPTNFCRLCRDFFRMNENGLQYCRNLFLSKQDVRSPNPYIDVCPCSGLLYAFIRIRLDDKDLATWIIGQVREKDSVINNISGIPDVANMDLKSLQDALLEMPEIDLSHFNEIARFINLYANELIQKSYQMLTQSTLIKSLKDIEEQLFNENTLFNKTMMTVVDGILLLGPDNCVLFMNPAAEAMTGWKAEELKGRILGEIVFDQEGTLPDFNERLHTNNLKSIFLKTKTGLKKEITLCATVIKKQNGEKTGTIINMHDPSEPQNDREEIIYLSYHDVLTGLFNRRYFEMRLKLLDAAHYLPLSILMGDVNGLKFTNDVFGHFAGDHLLFIVSEVMKKCCHENHIIARWGGDEFVILMPNTDERTATDIAKKISRECLQYDADKLTVSISFGYATKNTSEKRANDILTRAEDLMYKNKTSESKAFKAAAVEKIENRLFNTCYESLDQIKTLQELSKKISPFFNLSDIEIRELELLARMHDYGEIAINSYLLEKPSKLTKQEWKEVKKHPEIGYRIINTITSHLEVGELILTHHENWNGSGYPSGLSKTNIPILSRIFAVIDGYTAMLNERPYRKALSVESAVDNLKREAGTKYDPQVVEVFLKEIVKI